MFYIVNIVLQQNKGHLFSTKSYYTTIQISYINHIFKKILQKKSATYLVTLFLNKKLIIGLQLYYQP